MATFSNILAWKIPWTEEPGRQQSMGLPRVGYDFATKTVTRYNWIPCCILETNTTFGEGNGKPLQYSCLENPMDGGAWWAAVHGVTTESVATERLHFHFSVSCNGGWNGNPLQCSCLENPRDGRAWWAAVYGVAQSRTRLKRFSSSSSSSSSSNTTL